MPSGTGAAESTANNSAIQFCFTCAVNFIFKRLPISAVFPVVESIWAISERKLPFSSSYAAPLNPDWNNSNNSSLPTCM